MQNCKKKKEKKALAAWKLGYKNESEEEYEDLESKQTLLELS
jgi:regulator of RNase E activity RraB